MTPWAGREDDLALLETAHTPLAFITGIGGQGKSALAGEFLRLFAIESQDHFEHWDWRDCREESDRLGTQLLQIIERFSGGKIKSEYLEVADLRAIVQVLLQILDNQRVLFVFDNVDQYIDLNSLQPTKGLDVLVAEIQSRAHRSFFIFTCRPNVQIDESRSVRLPLSGLSEHDTQALMGARPEFRKFLHLSRDLHQTTQGHPLWTTLIMMQAGRHPRGLAGVLAESHEDNASLPDTTQTIWNNLTKQQRNVLLTMAELDRPEPESMLLDFVPGLNANRVGKAIRSLKSFHLVETRTRASQEPLLGLHPVIRAFVRTNFSIKERERNVTPILNFLDRMIGRFRPELYQAPSYHVLEHWTRKADYLITFGRFENAVDTIEDIGDALISRGYSEELIRVTVRLLSVCDWSVACISYRNFDSMFSRCLRHMIQGGHEDADDLLTSYEKAIPGQSAQFILLADLRCYASWFASDFNTAIGWGERGKALKDREGVDTVFSTDHNLALARRDAGRRGEALEFFLRGETLAVVVESGEPEEGKGGEFYGNIGRCLFLDGRTQDALACYKKSAKVLEKGIDLENIFNRGYIRLWLGELLESTGDYRLAGVFYSCAILVWRQYSPPRAELAQEWLDRVVAASPEELDFLDVPEVTLEAQYRQWLDQPD